MKYEPSVHHGQRLPVWSASPKGRGFTPMVRRRSLRGRRFRETLERFSLRGRRSGRVAEASSLKGWRSPGECESPGRGGESSPRRAEALRGIEVIRDRCSESLPRLDGPSSQTAWQPGRSVEASCPPGISPSMGRGEASGAPRPGCLLSLRGEAPGPLGGRSTLLMVILDVRRGAVQPCGRAVGYRTIVRSAAHRMSVLRLRRDTRACALNSVP